MPKNGFKPRSKMCRMCRTECVVGPLEEMSRNEHLVPQSTTHAAHFILVCAHRLRFTRSVFFSSEDNSRAE